MDANLCFLTKYFGLQNYIRYIILAQLIRKLDLKERSFVLISDRICANFRNCSFLTYFRLLRTIFVSYYIRSQDGDRMMEIIQIGSDKGENDNAVIPSEGWDNGNYLWQ